MMKSNKVVVMGSFVVDLMMRADRLPVQGETVKGNSFMTGAGGKGSNQGVAAAKSGANVVMITKIGADGFGEIAKESFRSCGMNTRYVFTDADYPTGAALIMVDENTSQNKIVVTIGASGKITHDDIEYARGEIESAAVFLTQLESNLDAVVNAINIAHNAGVAVILNPAPADRFPQQLYSKIDIFTPNETEAEFFCGIKIETEEDARAAAAFFLDKGVKNCIITMGKQGAFLMNKDISRLFPPFNVKVVDTTGAGDAFNGGLAAAYAEGKGLEDSVIFASAVASLSVTKLGTAKAMPAREEIDALITAMETKY
ncbi:MAG: ribokinase [Clostridia bacterium]|nr:ribokinase [Clostridia bacterium]